MRSESIYCNNNSISSSLNGLIIDHGTMIQVNNSMLSNNNVGVNIEDSDNITISNNIINDSGWGILTDDNEDIDITLNSIYRCGNGIQNTRMISGNISLNNITNSSFDGIRLHDSDLIILNENEIVSSNDRGIHIFFSEFTNFDSLMIHDNEFSDNGDYGIQITGSGSPSSVKIHHNRFIDNGGEFSQGAGGENGTWDYESYGNYWSDYDGTDTDGDNIGDKAYEIDDPGDVYDRYPLMSLDDSNTWIVDDDNGSWRDFEHIQDAINASEDGDTILVYEGYYYEDLVNVSVSVTIIGNGTEEVLVDTYTFDIVNESVTLQSMNLNYTEDGYIWIYGDSCTFDDVKTNITLRMYTNDSVLVNSELKSIEHSRGDRTRIQKNTIYGRIQMSRSNGFAFHDIDFDHTKTESRALRFGIKGHWNITNISVTNCRFDSSHAGIMLEATNMLITNCTFKDVTYGINVSSDSENVEIRNCEVSSGWRGYFVNRSKNVVMVDNSVRAEHGLFVWFSTNISIQNLDCIIVDDSHGNAIEYWDSNNVMMWDSSIVNTSISGNSDVTGIYLDGSPDNYMRNISVIDFSQSLWLDDNSSVQIVNSTLEEDGDDWGDDIWCGGSSITTLNTSFTTVNVWGDSNIIVQNYLHVSVVKATNVATEGVDIHITDNNVTVYSTDGYGGTDPQTGANGTAHWIVITDRTYTDNSTAIENVTAIEMMFGNWTEYRDINMSTSHTEKFTYIEPYAGPTWYVDDDNTGDPEMDGSPDHPFDTILRGMENATINHTLRVWAGTYDENVTVNHTGLWIIGNGSANTTIFGLGTGDVLWLYANDVTISGVRITNSGTGAGDAAIDTNTMTNVTIHDVLVAGSEYGIYIDGSHDVEIINSTAEDSSYGIRSEASQWINITNIDANRNTNTGIWMLDTDNVMITGGSIRKNTNDGIHLEDVPGAYISAVSIEDHGDDGIEISDSDQTVVSGCMIINSTFGIFSSQSSLVQVLSTNVTESSNDGMAFSLLSDNFLVENCSISDSNRGIIVDSTIGGRIGNTTISSSTSSDITVATTGSATTINSDFSSVSVDISSTLTVKNYLQIRVINQYNEPWNNADVNITDNDESVYASAGYNGTDPKTAKNGYIDWVLVTDRIYDGSSTAIENETKAYAMAEGTEANLTINMSWSHVEELVVNMSEEGILYVDDDNAGDPDMDGSRVHPFDTIQKGLDNATIGNVIRIWDGLYREVLNITLEVTLLGNGSTSEISSSDDIVLLTISSHNVTIESVNITNNFNTGTGIHAVDSDNLTIRNSILWALDDGIMINNSENVLIQGTEFERGDTGIQVVEGRNITAMDLSLTNINDEGLGYYNVDEIVIFNNTFDSVDTGIYLDDCGNVTISQCDLSGDDDGLYIFNSLNISMLSCNISTSENGVVIERSEMIHLEQIYIDQPRFGIESIDSSFVNITSSNIKSDTLGVNCVNSSNMVLESIEVISIYLGIKLNESTSIIMRNVSLEGDSYNFGVEGTSLVHYLHDIDTSNSVDGHEMIYLVSQPDMTYINGTYGYIGIVNSSAMVDVVVHNNQQGILAVYCDEVSIRGDLSRNRIGVYSQNSTSLNLTNVELIDTVYGMTIYETDNTRMVRSTIDDTRYALILHNDTDVYLENSTISSQQATEVDNSNVTTLNVSYSGGISVEDGQWVVMNYLLIHVNDTNGQDLEGADVQVKDNDDVIYASNGYGGTDPATNSDGYVRWIIVTDRIHGELGIAQNTTTVDVQTPQWSEQRDVDMTTSHTEWFDEVEPANEKPWVQIFDPEDGASISRSSSYVILGNATDNDGEVILVEIRFDSESSWQSCQGTMDWTYDWDTSLYSPGDHDIHVRSEDNNFEYSEVFTITVELVDNQAPNCTITAPENDVYVNGTVMIEGRADDPEGDMDEVEVAIMPEGVSPSLNDWVQADDTSGNGSWFSWEYEWDTMSPNRTDDGVYDIYARARDGENLTRAVTINVSLDNPDDPTVSIKEPKKDDELVGIITINGTARDPDHDGNVTDVYVAITERGVEPEGSDWQDAEDTSGSKDPYWFWEFEWDTTEIEDGNYTIHAMSYDGGNISEVLSRNVSIDNVNTLPRTFITFPEESDRLSGEVDVTGYTIDPDDELDSVDLTVFWIEDGEVQNQHTLFVPVQKVAWNRWNWTVSWDTRDEEPGNYTLQANSTDRRDGVSPEYLVNVTVWKNVPPLISFTNPDGVDDTVWKGEQSWFFIQWEDDDPDNNATIRIYYDDDDEDFDGTKLHDGVFYEDTLDDNGQPKDDYQWDVTDIPEGDYWLYATIEDGVNEDPTKVYAEYVLPIREGSPNVPPTVEIDQPDGVDDMIDPGDEFTIYFNVSDEDGDEVEVRIFYDTDDERSNGGFEEITETALTESRTEFKWDTDGVDKGSYYIMFKLKDVENEVFIYSDGPITIGDVIEPDGIGSPLAEDVGFGDTLNLTWTAPGDDGDEGRATAYLIRYDNEDITSEGRWDIATNVTNDLVPKEPGENEWIHVVLPDNGTYFFAVRAIDDEGNLGPIVTMSGTPTLLERTNEFSISGGFSIKLTWVGNRIILGGDGFYDDDIPTGVISLDAYVEVVPYGAGEYRDVRMEITYPSSLDDTNGIEDAKIYHLVGAAWMPIDDTETDTEDRTITADLEDLSTFGVFIPISEPPELSSLTYSPDFPTEDDTITFTVIFTYELPNVFPTEVYLFVDETRYEMSWQNGTSIDGMTFYVRTKLPKGEHDIVVKAYGNTFEEISSVETTIYVEEGDDESEFPIMIVAGIVIAVVVVVLLLGMSRQRKKKRAEEMAKEISPTAPVDVIEAEVYEAVVEFEGPPAFSEGEEPPAVAVAAAPAEAAPAEAAAPVEAFPEVPATPPPRLELPTVPGMAPIKKPEPEAPKAIETEVMDIGKIMVAPCPTCGHNLIIPKERPVDIKCPSCEDEFTIE